MSHRILMMAADEETFGPVRRFLVQRGHDVDFTTEPPMAEALLTCVPYSVLIADLELSSDGDEERSDIASFAHRQCSATRVVIMVRSGADAPAPGERGRADALMAEPTSFLALRGLEHLLEAS
jgi:hypothetical protein